MSNVELDDELLDPVSGRPFPCLELLLMPGPFLGKSGLLLWSHSLAEGRQKT